MPDGKRGVNSQFRQSLEGKRGACLLKKKARERERERDGEGKAASWDENQTAVHEPKTKTQDMLERNQTEDLTQLRTKDK